MLLYEEKIKKILIFQASFLSFYLLSTLCSEKFIYLIESLFPHIKDAEIVLSNVLNFVLSKITMFIIISFVRSFEDEVKYIKRFRSTFILLLITILILTILSSKTLLLKDVDDTFILFLSVMLAELVFFYFAIYFAMTNVYNFFIKDKEEALMLLHNKIMENYIEQRDESLKEISKLSHDLKHTVFYWEELAKENRNEELLNSVKEYKNKIYQNDLTSIGNFAADAIINKYIKILEKENISYSIKGSFKENIIISDVDICSLLGNLFENAIEATMKIPNTSKREVNFKIINEKSQVFIVIENTYLEEPIKEKNGFKTKKKDANFHGLGLKIVNKIVEKYHGVINIEHLNKVFMIYIMIEIYKET